MRVVLSRVTCGQSKDFVRAQILGGGFYMKPIPNNPNQCEMIYIAHTDLKGSLPSSITKAVGVKQPLIVSVLDGILKKPDGGRVDTSYVTETLRTCR